MPSKAVLWFDTVVLSNFIFADSFEWLETRYKDRIYITSEVLDEITSGISTGRTKLRIVYSSLQKGTITLHNIEYKELELYSQLRKYLGPGESSCITGAISSGGIVVTDDRRARVACKANGVKVTGTIGILASACNCGKLTTQQADVMLSKMKKNGYFSPVTSIKDIFLNDR